MVWIHTSYWCLRIKTVLSSINHITWRIIYDNGPRRKTETLFLYKNSYLAEFISIFGLVGHWSFTYWSVRKRSQTWYLKGRCKCILSTKLYFALDTHLSFCFSSCFIALIWEILHSAEQNRFLEFLHYV